MEGVPTHLNVADTDTKRLTRTRRDFLMYLMGMVDLNEDENKFEKVGQTEFDNYLQKKFQKT